MISDRAKESTEIALKFYLLINLEAEYLKNGINDKRDNDDFKRLCTLTVYEEKLRIYNEMDKNLRDIVSKSTFILFERLSKLNQIITYLEN